MREYHAVRGYSGRGKYQIAADEAARTPPDALTRGVNQEVGFSEFALAAPAMKKERKVVSGQGLAIVEGLGMGL